MAPISRASPILRAPPPEPGLTSGSGVLGLAPTALLLAGLLLHPHWRRDHLPPIAAGRRR